MSLFSKSKAEDELRTTTEVAKDLRDAEAAYQEAYAKYVSAIDIDYLESKLNPVFDGLTHSLISPLLNEIDKSIKDVEFAETFIDDPAGKTQRTVFNAILEDSAKNDLAAKCKISPEQLSAAFEFLSEIQTGSIIDVQSVVTGIDGSGKENVYERQSLSSEQAEKVKGLVDRYMQRTTGKSLEQGLHDENILLPNQSEINAYLDRIKDILDEPAKCWDKVNEVLTKLNALRVENATKPTFVQQIQSKAKDVFADGMKTVGNMIFARTSKTVDFIQAKTLELAGKASEIADKASELVDKTKQSFRQSADDRANDAMKGFVEFKKNITEPKPKVIASAFRNMMSHSFDKLKTICGGAKQCVQTLVDTVKGIESKGNEFYASLQQRASAGLEKLNQNIQIAGQGLQSAVQSLKSKYEEASQSIKKASDYGRQIINSVSHGSKELAVIEQIGDLDRQVEDLQTTISKCERQIQARNESLPEPKRAVAEIAFGNITVDSIRDAADKCAYLLETASFKDSKNGVSILEDIRDRCEVAEIRLSQLNTVSSFEDKMQIISEVSENISDIMKPSIQNGYYTFVEGRIKGELAEDNHDSPVNAAFRELESLLNQSSDSIAVAVQAVSDYKTALSVDVDAVAKANAQARTMITDAKTSIQELGKKINSLGSELRSLARPLVLMPKAKEPVKASKTDKPKSKPSVALEH